MNGFKSNDEEIRGRRKRQAIGLAFLYHMSLYNWDAKKWRKPSFSAGAGVFSLRR